MSEISFRICIQFEMSKPWMVANATQVWWKQDEKGTFKLWQDKRCICIMSFLQNIVYIVLDVQTTQQQPTQKQEDWEKQQVDQVVVTLSLSTIINLPTSTPVLSDSVFQHRK